jgi:diguanylate cyclase (GGDEF)-like protein
MSSVRARRAVTLSGDSPESPSSMAAIPTTSSLALPRRRPVPRRTAIVLTAAAAAIVPLVLATWAFGRTYSQSEVGRTDARLVAGAQIAIADVGAAAADASRSATRLSSSRAVQAMLERGEPTQPRRIASFRDGYVVAVAAPAGIPKGAASVRAVDIRRGSTLLGTVAGVVDLRAVAHLVTEKTGLQTFVRLSSVGAPSEPNDVRIHGERYRALAQPVGGGRAVVLAAPHSAVAKAVERKQLVTLGAGVSTLAALAALVLLLPRNLRTRRSGYDDRATPRRRSAASLVGDVAVAAHDPHALLPVLLEAAVVATEAAGGRVVWNGDELAAIGGRSAPELVLALDDDLGAARLVLYPGSRPFEARDLEILESLVAQGRVALENARLQGIVRRQAQTDELTDLANRRRFMETLQYEVARAQRFESELSLVLFDLDRFKRINDRCGHQIGDAVLRDTASVVRERVRETDLVARVGGEEFAVVLPGTDLSGAVTFADGLRADIERDVRVEGVAWRVTASFGVAAAHHGDAVDHLIAAADRALYRAKAAGRNTVRAADDTSAATL